MKTSLIICLAVTSSLPLLSDIKVDTTAPKLPPPPTDESITLNPALVDKLTKEIGQVIQTPDQKTVTSRTEQGAPPLIPLPGTQPAGTPPGATPAQAGAPVASPASQPLVPAAAAPGTAPESAAPAVAPQTLLQAPVTGDILAQWYTAVEAYGTDSMLVRLLGLLQSLNPQKPIAQHTDAYTAALTCHRLALSGNAEAMRQLAQAFECGTLAGLVFPQSMVASYFFLNRAQSTLPDLKPAPAAP